MNHRNDEPRHGRDSVRDDLRNEWDHRDQGTRGGEYAWREPGQGQGAGGRSFRETEFVSQNTGGRSDLGSGQGFGSQDYSRNPYYAGVAPGGRGMGGQSAAGRDMREDWGPQSRSQGPGDGQGYGPSPHSQGGRGGYASHSGRSQRSYGSGRDFGGQGGYGGGYGESAGGSFEGQRGYGGYRQPGGDDRGGRSYWGHGGGTGGGQSAYGQGTGRSFRGQGPKGWKRSDERLQEDICARLTDDHHVDPSDVSVTAKDGIVTLEGSVGHRAAKHRIEDLVEQCAGVSEIRNNIAVKRGTGDR